MSGVGCECFVGKKCEWTKAWGGGMDGVGEWVGWVVHFPGREGRGRMDRGVRVENRWGGGLSGVGYEAFFFWGGGGGG